MKSWSDSDLYVVREMGRVFLSEGRCSLARQVFRGLVALDPSDSYAQSGLGMALIQLGEFEAADQALAEAIRLDPEDWTAALHLAEFRLRRGISPAARDAAQLAERATRANHCPADVRRRAEYIVRIHQRA